MVHIECIKTHGYKLNFFKKKALFLFTKVSNRDELICLNEENECPSIVE